MPAGKLLYLQERLFQSASPSTSLMRHHNKRAALVGEDNFDGQAAYAATFIHIWKRD